jgi:hypothetical protein
MPQPDCVIRNSSELLRNGHARERVARIQQLVKVELVINPKTAKNSPLLGRADEVISKRRRQRSWRDQPV